MLFQCSARLTLIWLSGSALLCCQAVWAMAKLFEGACRRGVVCLCQAETGCSDARPASVPRLSLPHLLPSSPQPTFHSLHLLPQSQPCFFSPCLSLSLPHTCRDRSAHTCIHFLLLSKASLKELWPCGLEEIQTLCHFVGFFPKPLKHNTAVLICAEKVNSTCRLMIGGNLGWSKQLFPLSANSFNF